jgi:putative resolvase
MNCKQWMNPQEVAISLGISVRTPRRWDKAGKLHTVRTADNHRCIALTEIQHLRGQDVAIRCALYARFSSFKQAREGNLARQLERLRVAAIERGYQVVQAIAEHALSLNEKRRGMKELLSLGEQQALDVILIEYPYRLVRFGFGYLQETFRWHQVRVEVLDPPERTDQTTELLANMLTIVTVFSGKLCAYRAHANPRRKASVIGSIDERQKAVA